MISITNPLRIFVVWTQFAAFLRQASRPLMCPDAFVFFVQGIPRNFLLQKKDTARKERCPRKFLFKNHLRITPLSAPVRYQPQEPSCLS